MRIKRGDFNTRLSLPFNVDVSQVNAVVITKGDPTVRIVFGDGIPTSEMNEAGYDYVYIDRASGIAYVWNSDTLTSEVHPYVALDMADPNIPTLRVPVALILYAGKFQVDWFYEVYGQPVRDSETHEVFEPLFTADELKSFDPDFKTIDETAIDRLERIVRNVVESITGQKFHLRRGTVIAKVYGGKAMMMPERVVSLDDKYIGNSRVDVRSDGWVVRAMQPVNEGTTYLNTSPIYDPYTYLPFRDNEYSLSGEFGYASVPETIKLAAMILAQDYGCHESAWRDRYIETMKNANWGVTYNEGAFKGTGNVKVDRILESYTINRMVLV